MRALQLRIHELHAEMERLGMAKVCVVGLAWSFVGPRVTKGAQGRATAASWEGRAASCLAALETALLCSAALKPFSPALPVCAWLACGEQPVQFLNVAQRQGSMPCALQCVRVHACRLLTHHNCTLTKCLGMLPY